MKEPVADGVGERGLVDGLMPFLGRQLTGDDDRTCGVAIFDDFEEVLAFVVGGRGQEEVVEDEELDFSEPVQGFEVGAVALGLAEDFEEPGGTKVLDGEPGTRRMIAQSTGEPGFPDAGGTGDENVSGMGDPLGVGQLQEDLFIQAARMAVVDVFESGLVAEPGHFEEFAQADIFAVGFFVLGEETDEVGVGEFLGLRM